MSILWKFKPPSSSTFGMKAILDFWLFVTNWLTGSIINPFVDPRAATHGLEDLKVWVPTLFFREGIPISWIWDFITVHIVWNLFSTWKIMRNEYPCYVCGNYFMTKYDIVNHLQNNTPFFVSHLQILIFQSTFIKCKPKTNWQFFL